MAIVSTASSNQRSQTHYVLTDTGYREQEPWVQDVPKHVEAFLRAGGKIEQVPLGVSALNKKGQDKAPAFRINVRSKKTNANSTD